jgi:hypothetical protein
MGIALDDSCCIFFALPIVPGPMLAADETVSLLSWPSNEGASWTVFPEVRDRSKSARFAFSFERP